MLVVTGNKSTNPGRVVRSARRALTKRLPAFVSQLKSVVKPKLVTEPKVISESKLGSKAKAGAKVAENVGC